MLVNTKFCLFISLQNYSIFGGIDTQRTLPFGTPTQVRDEVRERIKIFGVGGGFIFNTIHNVQPRVPVKNIIKIYETLHKFGTDPLSFNPKPTKTKR